MDDTVIVVGIFFVGLMFAWLKLDLGRIEKKVDGHLVSHGKDS
jgi:hypothetical protein